MTKDLVVSTLLMVAVLLVTLLSAIVPCWTLLMRFAVPVTTVPVTVMAVDAVPTLRVAVTVVPLVRATVQNPALALVALVRLPPGRIKESVVSILLIVAVLLVLPEAIVMVNCWQVVT